MKRKRIYRSSPVIVGGLIVVMGVLTNHRTYAQNDLVVPSRLRFNVATGDNTGDKGIIGLNAGAGKKLMFYNYHNSSRLMVIDGDNGNVGIGTASPQYKLDVADKVIARGMPLIVGADQSPDQHSSRFATFYDPTLNNSDRYINFGKYPTAYNCGEIQYMHKADASPANWVSMGFYGHTDAQRLYVLANGNVGVGTPSPNSKLQVSTGGVEINGGNNVQVALESLSIRASSGGRNTVKGAQLDFVLPANTDGSNFWSQARIVTVAGNERTSDATGKMILGTRRMFNKLGSGAQWYYGDDLVIDGQGNIGISTTSPNAKLAVNGNIRAKEVKVEAANWPDYVFGEDYKLPDLNELSAYIRENRHLPGMPSAKEAEADGIDLGEMNRKLLEKVEELTLLLIEKDNEVGKLKEQRIVHEERLDDLLKRLEALEK